MVEHLQLGDRVRISGGYDMEPKWLNGNAYFEGVIISFIPGQNERPAAVVKLETDVTFDDLKGRTLVLELRHVGSGWQSGETVHVELCNFDPEAKSWKDRRQGKWVESHATVRKF